MTLVEVMIAMPIVLVALSLFVRLLMAGIGLRDVGRDYWAASAAAQEVLEEMRNENFREMVVLYNEDPFDDPGGPGTAPGNTFLVDGLDVLGSGATSIGEVLMPTSNQGTEVVPLWQLREDLELPELAMPRDLNGDILLDDQDHIDDYTLLPVLVRLEWRGPNGPRRFRLQTVFTEVR